MNSTKSLLEALGHVAPCCRKAGGVYVQDSIYCDAGWILASNGAFCAGAKTEEVFTATPKLTLLKAALQKCSKAEPFSLSSISASSIAVTQGAFKAVLKCEQFLMSDVFADAPLFEINGAALKAAIGSASAICIDAEEDFKKCVLLDKDLANSCNGFAAIQAYHGCNLPKSFYLHKAFCNIIAKCSKDPVNIGFSESTITFHYEDGSFYSCRLSSVDFFPALNVLFPECPQRQQLPDEFWQAMQTVSTFSENSVYFDDGFIKSTIDDCKASTFEFEGLPSGMGFNSKVFMQCKGVAKTCFFDRDRETAVFYSDTARGILKALSFKKAVLQTKTPVIEDDDIPF